MRKSRIDADTAPELVGIVVAYFQPLRAQNQGLEIADVTYTSEDEKVNGAQDFLSSWIIA